MTLSPWFRAREVGHCTGCGGTVQKNDKIRSQGQGQYLCFACGTEGQEAEAGPNEMGVLADLNRFPAEATCGAIAQNMLYLAQQLDQGFVASRDAGTYTKEIRQGLITLTAMYPPKPEEDDTDGFLTRRQQFLSDTRES